MKLYSIPDIRLFWSKDSGFLHQFKVENINEPITYKVGSFIYHIYTKHCYLLGMIYLYCRI